MSPYHPHQAHRGMCIFVCEHITPPLYRALPGLPAYTHTDSALKPLHVRSRYHRRNLWTDFFPSVPVFRFHGLSFFIVGRKWYGDDHTGFPRQEYASYSFISLTAGASYLDGILHRPSDCRHPPYMAVAATCNLRCFRPGCENLGAFTGNFIYSDVSIFQQSVTKASPAR